MKTGFSSRCPVDFFTFADEHRTRSTSYSSCFSTYLFLSQIHMNLLCCTSIEFLVSRALKILNFKTRFYQCLLSIDQGTRSVNYPKNFHYRFREKSGKSPLHTFAKILVCRVTLEVYIRVIKSHFAQKLHR